MVLTQISQISTLNSKSLTLNVRVDRRVQWIVLIDRRYHKKKNSTLYLFLILKSQKNLMEKYYVTVKRTTVRGLLFYA